MVIEGKLHRKFDTVDVSGTFRKRDFVVEYIDGSPLYPQYVTFQLIKDNVTKLDPIHIGDKVEVTFSLRGREWTSPEGEKKYFNTLEAWRLSPIVGEGASAAPTESDIDDTGDSDLPF